MEGHSNAPTLHRAHLPRPHLVGQLLQRGREGPAARVRWAGHVDGARHCAMSVWHGRWVGGRPHTVHPRSLVNQAAPTCTHPAAMLTGAQLALVNHRQAYTAQVQQRQAVLRVDLRQQRSSKMTSTFARKGMPVVDTRVLACARWLPMIRQSAPHR